MREQVKLLEKKIDVDCVKPLVINNELFFIVLPALPVLPAKKYNLFKVFLIISSADFRRR